MVEKNSAKKLNVKNGNIEFKNITFAYEEGKNIFVSRFRNCMMHYNLNKDNEFSISENNFSWDKPFFGLIEECFDGMSYRDYVERLEKFGDVIEEFITKQFDFERIHLKEF